MSTPKQAFTAIAIRALNVLAVDIHAGANLWPTVDRIERRFKLSGYTGQRVCQLERQKAQWCAAWITRNVPWDMRREYLQQKAMAA